MQFFTLAVTDEFYGGECSALREQSSGPSGEPLRAKVDLAFVGTMGTKEEALTANRSSPNLTHVVLVKAGDSLPLLCHRIYGDSAYYAAVARYNRIANFRVIRPGPKIVFTAVR